MIAIAGATGNLGTKIIDALIIKGVEVKAIVRQQTDERKIISLRNKGVSVLEIDFENTKEIAKALAGSSCVISALAGLEDVIVDTQTKLLDGAILAKVPRFIPSDFCTDFTKLIPGKNRNLDSRRNFHDYLNKQDIKASSIFNGAFMELTTGDMPLIMSGKSKILCWGNPDVKMDFTTTFNIAEYTASVAVDENAPRYSHIAGATMSANDFKILLSELDQKPYKLLRPGGIGFFNFVIGIAKFLDFKKTDLYPAWQGMQYMRDMMEGRAELASHDNDRYQMDWTSMKQYLSSNRNN